MIRPSLLPLSECIDPSLVGGKAYGLARLLAAGFPVPNGFCVTTEAYIQTLQAMGFSAIEEWNRVCRVPPEDRQTLLADCQERLRQADVSHVEGEWQTHLQMLRLPRGTRWAIRSSATNEDTSEASFAGLYRTHLGIAVEAIPAAVKDLWASLWDEAVVHYMLQRGLAAAPPAMAVVIQPMLHADAAGVAYSIHPVTGRSTQVAINAIFGLATPLVDGEMMPDHFVVEMNDRPEPAFIRRRLIADKPSRLTVGEKGLLNEPIIDAARYASSLSDHQLFELARKVKQIEQAFNHPVDVEWVFDTAQLWMTQARPITTVRPSSELTNDDCEWTRANFKETMPEVPSPMGLSFLQYFMDAYILSHYRRLGCRIPEGLSSVRVLHGRPYLNATLFYSLVGQLGGNPSLNVEQMGGVQLLAPPTVTRIGWGAFLRAGFLMWKEMRRCETSGPAWFREMKQLAEAYDADRVRSFSREDAAEHLDQLGRWLDRHELTFGIAGGVGQCLQAFSQRLPRWLGQDWRTLLNAALQGQGTVISAQQIVQLAGLVQIARRELPAQAWLRSTSWRSSEFRAALNGTEFLRAFEDYLHEYGHRAVGESDIMSPRIAEQPDSILRVIRAQVEGASSNAPDEILARQARGRRKALHEIRRRLGWRLDRRASFLWWYRRLTRFFALREANRHHLMFYSSAARHLLLRLGEVLVASGQFDTAEDIFFVTLEERPGLLSGAQTNWKALIAARRAEKARHTAVQVPDTIRDWPQAVSGLPEFIEADRDGMMQGLPISGGRVSGPIRLVQSPSDWCHVLPGDILVASVIDPGLAPLFGLAGGLIVEMGGTLSHGAIIAREYGLPTLANVPGAMTRLSPGQWVTLDADAGTIISTSPSDSNR